MPSIKSIPLLKRCLRYFSPYKLLVAGSLVSLIIVAACTAGSAYLVQPALDKIFINKDQAALATLPIILVLVFLGKGVAAFFQRFLMSYCGLKVLEELRNELFGKIICLPVDFFSDNRVGMLMSRIISDVNLISTSLPTIINMCRHALTMLGLIGLVIYRDPFLAFLAMLVFPLAIYPVIFFGKKLRKIGRKSQGKIADISALLQESFSGLRVVKAFATEDKEREKFAAQNGKWVKLTIRGKVYNQMSSPIMEIIGAIGAGLVIWYGGSQVIAGESTPGTFFSFLTAMIMLYEPFKSISSANMSIQNALAGAERVFEILDDPKIRIESSGDTTFTPPFSTLELKNVSFTYPGNESSALSEISLQVRAGEKIALVGSSGAGKSTLVNLIPRFHDPQQGTISLNGISLYDYTLPSLRRNIGLVSQDPFLFNMSIRENIAYGMVDTSDEAVIAAAQAAYAHDFITELPEGYDTIIGERGVKLSGGQKQRITIARAILKDPALLILDEATSALDTESERIVQQALENLMRKRTSIIIAHRLSTVLSADKIFVMDQGTVKDYGTHEHLLETSSTYKKLHDLQFKKSSHKS